MPLDQIKLVRLAIGAYNQEWRALGDGSRVGAELRPEDVVGEEKPPPPARGATPPSSTGETRGGRP